MKIEKLVGRPFSPTRCKCSSVADREDSPILQQPGPVAPKLPVQLDVLPVEAQHRCHNYFINTIVTSELGTFYFFIFFNNK